MTGNAAQSKEMLVTVQVAGRRGRAAAIRLFTRRHQRKIVLEGGCTGKVLPHLGGGWGKPCQMVGKG